MPRETPAAPGVVVVTGAASGIGRAVARILAGDGAAVGLVDCEAGGLEALAEELAGGGARVHTVTADVAEPDAPARAVSELRDALGAIDALVNNAGVAIPAPIDGDGFEDAWATTLAVNLTAQQRFIRAALPDLRRDGAGRVVNLASTEGLGATPAMAPYTASKHGVIGLTRALAVELGPSGVTVNCVCPGPTDTGMTALIPDEHKQVFAKRRTALRRYAAPEEIAYAVVSLLDPRATYITGAVIVADGGLTIRNA